MKIYVSHSRSFDFENNLYKPIRESKLNDFHDFFLPHEHGRVVNSIEYIKTSDLIIAEVSFPSTGQGIELGLAYMSNVPILCVSKKDSHIAGSLKSITNNFIEYADTQDFIDQIGAYIASQ